MPGLPRGAPAPAFRLAGLTGETLTLETLRAPGNPVVLIFADPDCGPCTALLPDLAHWQREHAAQLTIALISRGTVAANQAKTAAHGVTHVLLQKDQEVADAYQVSGTPTAVLVRPDGTIGSPLAPGKQAIAALVSQAVALPTTMSLPLALPAPTVAANGRCPHCGHAHGHAHNGSHAHNGTGAAPAPSQPPAVPIGQPAPALHLTDLHGEPVDLAAFRGRPTLLVFWNPGCGFCQRMLPDLKAWEEHTLPGAPQPLIVSTGTAEANQAMGLRSPIVLDEAFTAGRTFGVTGTPSAVLIDAQGHVASTVAVGAAAILTLAAGSNASPPPPDKPVRLAQPSPSQLLATPMPRRGSLRLLASAVAGALLPGFVPRRALGQTSCPPPGSPGDTQACSVLDGTQTRIVCCPQESVCCPSGGLNACCPIIEWPPGSGTHVPLVCCGTQQLSGPGCCPPGFACGLQGDFLECIPCPEGQSPCGSLCCPEGQTCCGGICVNMLQDSSNCGSCGHGCDAAHPTCCSGVCVNTQTDSTNCGGCSTGVDPDPHACATDLSCCHGGCVDVTSDNNNCGGCGIACNPGISTCEDGLCVCNPLYVPCGQVCCPTVGYACCTGASGPICIRTDADPNNCGDCGVRCPANTTCEHGHCVCESNQVCDDTCCANGQVCCNGVCRDPQSFQDDPANCGTCGKQCLAPLRPPGAIMQCCNRTCVDIKRDLANCGGCGNVCVGECKNGTCKKAKK
jgi:peroxiredoxin